MIKRLFISFLAISFVCLKVSAQETLTLEKAVQLALENNNLLKVSKLNRQITQNDFTPGNAGFMPTVVFSGSTSNSKSSIDQHIFSAATGTISEIKKSGVGQSNISGGPALNWVIFNGFRRTNMYQRLKLTYEQADAQTKSDINNTIASVIAAYYEILRQKEINDAYENNLELYRQRLKLAQARLANGLASKSDVLLSQVDINTQKSILIRQQSVVETARTSLNQLLNLNPSEVYVLPNTVRTPVTDTNLVFGGKNPALTVTQKAIDISKRQIAETRSVYMPIFSVTAAYNLSQSQSQAGQVQLNLNYGPTWGFNLSWSLFDGFNKNRLTNDSRFNFLVAQYQHEQNKRIQETAFEQAMIQYKMAVTVLQMETESFGLATESYEIARQRYEAGYSNLFEFKDTQLALEASKIRLANARYDALTAETNLARTNNTLVNP